MIRYISYITISVFSFLACTQAGPCGGSLVLTNPIPDTTVAVGDTLYIDLANPPVFVSSEGRVTYSYKMDDAVSKVDLAVLSKNDNDIKLQIIGLQKWEGSIGLEATSGCLQNGTFINLIITEQ